MSDYVERDKAIDTITEYGWGDNVYMSVGNLVGRIEQLPPADDQPVVHGEWIKIECHTYRCSQCGKTIITNSDYIKEHKFCFGCGAKLEVKSDVGKSD